MLFASKLADIWRAKWGIVRLAFAGLLLSTLIRDNPSRITRLQIAAMPHYDYLHEIQKLRSEGRYGEAMTVSVAGREALVGDDLIALESETKKVQDEQSSWMRRAKEAAIGAVTGDGKSLEAMAGAITADMFIVGDVRDLLIQGAHQVIDGESDKVIVALSSLGVVLAVMPEINWMDSIFKIARKAGRLTERLTEEIIKICRKAVSEKKYEEAEKVAEDVWSLSKRSSPGEVLALLPYIEETKDLTKVTEFAKEFEDGAFVLHVCGRDGVEIIKVGDKEAQEALRLMARKGDRGMAWMRGGKSHLLKPHPILGLLKGTYKGTIPRFVARLTDDFLDPWGWWIIPSVVLWVIAELYLLYHRIFRLAQSPRVAE